MAQTNRGRDIRVVGSTEHEAEHQLRRVGRAIIALARAQLEAEAQAAHESKRAPAPDAGGGADDADEQSRRAS